MAKVITDDTEVKQGHEGTNVNRADLWLVVGVAAWSCGLEMDMTA